MRIDVHTHHYPSAFFDLIEQSGGDFSFATDPAGRRIIRYKGSRFFGITPPMTDLGRRIEDMDRVGIDVAVLSLSTPNVCAHRKALPRPGGRLRCGDGGGSNSPSRAIERSASTKPVRRT